MDSFDFDGARKAGASDEQILDFIKSKRGVNFDIGGALDAGANATQVVDFLRTNQSKVFEQPGFMGRALRATGEFIAGAAKQTAEDISGAFSKPKSVMDEVKPEAPSPDAASPVAPMRKEFYGRLQEADRAAPEQAARRAQAPDVVGTALRDIRTKRIASIAEGSQPYYGKRLDGTDKGPGFLGELKRPDGDVSTELSIGVNIDGKETEIPSLVPTLTSQEVEHLLAGGEPTKAIVDKATAHARQRLAEGKSVFAQSGEIKPITATQDVEIGTPAKTFDEAMRERRARSDLTLQDKGFDERIQGHMQQGIANRDEAERLAWNDVRKGIDKSEPAKMWLRKGSGLEQWSQSIADAVEYHLPASVAAAIKGSGISLADDKSSVLDTVIRRGEQRTADRMRVARDLDKEVLPGLSTKDIIEFGPNLGTTLAAGGIIVATSGLGALPGGVIGFASMKRMDENQIARQLRTAANEESISRTGKPLTAAQWGGKLDQMKNEIAKHGDVEGIFEYGGTAAELAILKSAAAIFGTSWPARVVSKMMALGAMELVSEAATQIGQKSAEVKMGLAQQGEQERSYLSLSDWVKSAKEVAPQTLLLTATVGGVGGAIRTAYERGIADPRIADETKRAAAEGMFDTLPLPELNKIVPVVNAVAKRRSKDIELQSAAQALRDARDRKRGEIDALYQAGAVPTEQPAPQPVADEVAPEPQPREPVDPNLPIAKTIAGAEGELGQVEQAQAQAVAKELLADPKAIFQGALARGMNEQGVNDTAEAVKSILADPNQIFALARQRPDIYNTLAEVAAEKANRGANTAPTGVATAAPTQPTSTQPLSQAAPASPAQSTVTPQSQVQAAFEEHERTAALQRDAELARLAREAAQHRQDENLALEVNRAELAGSGLRPADQVPPTALENAFAHVTIGGKRLAKVSSNLLEVAARSANAETSQAARTEIERRLAAETAVTTQEQARMAAEGGRPLESRSDRAVLESIAARESRARGEPAPSMEHVAFEQAPKVAQRMAKAVKAVFGRDVIFSKSEYDQQENRGHDALYDPVTGKIVVNVNSTRAWRKVIGHELLHALKRVNPQVYNRLLKSVIANVHIPTADAIYGGAYGDVSVAAQLEEMVADLLGEHMDSPMFWLEAFRVTPKSNVKALYHTLMMGLDAMRLRIRIGERVLGREAQEYAGREGFGTQRFIVDVEATRKAVASAYVQWQSAPEAEKSRVPFGAEPAMQSRSRRDKQPFREFAKTLPRNAAGEVVGAKGQSNQDIWRMVQRMEALARQGVEHKNWYRESAQAVLQAFDGNKQAADIFLQIIAITSANREVKANFTLAEKALVQYVDGEQIAVGSQAINDKLNDLLYFGIPWEGRKTNNFYRAHAEIIGIDVKRPETVVDMHMGNMSLGKKQVTDAEYTFVDKLTGFVAQRAGMTKKETQAASWVAQKARHLMDAYAKKGFHADLSDAGRRRHAIAQAAIHYGDLVRSRWQMLGPEVREFPSQEEARSRGVRITAEVKPSTKLDIGRAAAQLSIAQLQRYQDDAFKAVFGDKGARSFFEAFGLDRTQYRVVDGAIAAS